jgi:hypothetical protein
MKIARSLVAGAAAVIALSACSALDPYPTRPIDASPGEASGTRVGICYDTLVSTLDQVQAAAQQECSPNTQATPVRTDWYLTFCPLLLPARATFICSPTSK